MSGDVEIILEDVEGNGKCVFCSGGERSFWVFKGAVGQFYLCDDCFESIRQKVLDGMRMYPVWCATCGKMEYANRRTDLPASWQFKEGNRFCPLCLGDEK